MAGRTRPDVVVFDVNETLLDLRSMHDLFAEMFGDSSVTAEWFGLLLRSSMVATLIDDYHDFAALAGAALQMVAERRGVALDPDQPARIGDTLRTLPAHSDVASCLDLLGGAGMRLAALTNSPPATAAAQLTNAGLADRFERIMSVDPTRRFKPAPEPYLRAAGELGIDIGRMMMVAAHDWDVAGAMAAGAMGAFVARPGMVLNPLQARPDVTGEHLVAVAEAILAMEAAGP